MLKYSSLFNPQNVPQSAPLPGREAEMVRNDAGGYVFTVNKWVALKRFLVLGTEGGTYYTTERKHTLRAVAQVQAAIDEDAQRVFDTVKELLVRRLVPRRDACVFALALLVKKAGAWARPAVELMQTGTDALHLAAAVNDLRGWGPTVRRAFARWYVDRTPSALAYQLVKYQQRDGWSHRDVLRLAHAKPPDDAHNQLFKWAVGKGGDWPEYVRPFEAAKGLDATQAAERAHLATLIRDHGLTREMLPTAALNYAEVWEALLDKMPHMAMVRNLANMTRVGLVAPWSAAEGIIVGRLAETSVSEAGLHPMHYYLAAATYASGRGRQGRNWKPSTAIVEALNAAFVAAFKNVHPSGKRLLIAIDVSGSMTVPVVNTMIPTSAAAAAMALVLVKTEPLAHTIMFDTAVRGCDLTKCTSVTDVQRITSQFSGGTDLAQPFMYALANKLPADGFVTYTDTETWAGRQHAAVAFDAFKRQVQPARAINVAMAATTYSQLDQRDPDVLEVVGFDASVPQIVAQFVNREL